MYKPVSSSVSFPDVETEILAFWKQNATFQKSVTQAAPSGEFVFYDGPPFATGLPHYGHLLAGTIKDIVPRYQTMRGHHVERRFGWDCHGLPVEYEVEQALEISGKTDIEKLGVDVFNERCRSIVLRYTAEWREVVTRMGRWVDFDRDYKTMNPEFMESIWWVFKTLWEKGLVYEGRKILPYCPRCATPLSNFETNQGYQDVTDPAITVRFKVKGQNRTWLLAWTTTPWTLPSNVALAVGPDCTYVKVKDGDDTYYLAKDRVAAYYKTPDSYEVLAELTGRDLVGIAYEPLFDYFVAGGAPASAPETGKQAWAKAYHVYAGDFVTTTDGTGMVHIAPGFGEDDHRLGLAEGLPVLCPIDAEAKFTAEIRDFAGRPVKEADSDIIKLLKTNGSLVKRDSILHSYPHCWRCETPLIYRAIATWFVKVEAIKDRMMAANAQIRWVPSHLKDGRFGKWIEGARDWAISRNRYWGTPIPVWQSDDGKEIRCVGSIAELEKLSGMKVTDLHKHHVDKIELPSADGKGTLKRIPEVLDCWFESGSMPYAQAHYPFENKEWFEANFPADFIAEGLDQTRGWFYTLMVLSVALFDRPAFQNVVVNGLVLAADGRKMSKRLKNYPDPAHVINTYGADALRLYLIHSPVVRAEDLRFSEEGVKQVLRHLLIPLWNSYSFFVTYANIDGWTSERMAGDVPSRNVLDRWIRSSLETLIADVTAALDAYDLQKAIRPMVAFIEDLTNWYIRRSRRRFWKSQDDADKAEAYGTLNHVLIEFAKVAAPVIPFVSEAIYLNLRTATMPESVHLCSFPQPNPARRDVELEKQMAEVVTVVELGRQLRSAHDLKVRQPLSALHVVSRESIRLDRVRAFEDLVLEELNVKRIVYGGRETDLANLKLKADFKKLGPRLGADMKKAAGLIAALPLDRIELLAAGGSIELVLGTQTLVLGPDDVVIERTPKEKLVVASAGCVVVALETDVTPELAREGLAREFVNKVQSMRKTADFEVTQRIRITYVADGDIAAAVGAFEEYVRNETLAVSCVATASAETGTDWDLNGKPCRIQVDPV